MSFLCSQAMVKVRSTVIQEKPWRKFYSSYVEGVSLRRWKHPIRIPPYRGEAAVRTEESSEFDISACPIMFYGQKYEQLYLNLTNNNIVICFNGFYNHQTRADCLLGPKVEKVYFEVHDRFSLLEEQIHENVPHIKTSMTCYVYFELWQNDSVAVYVLVDDSVVDTLTVTNPSDYVYNAAYADISGCRHSGLVYKAGAVVYSVPETCFSFICSETAVLQNSSCGPLELCQGNGICLLDAICTVTGPAAIDFYGRLDFVHDRCVYSLLKIPSVSNFQMLAKFQERRRKDVSFLDSVKLQLNGSYIHLKQGGRVLIDETPLNFNSSIQMNHGMEISKDQTGVTVKVSVSNFTISVFFDGYTTQIHIEGTGGSSLQGLCQNSSEARLPEYSSTSCETLYNDTDDRSINCTKMTERCNLLKEAPFTSCDIDPEPYITACTDTLSRYPAVDGLKCQFLEAYARACSLKSNTTLEGWRSKTESSPEAFCQDRACSDHEFCGKKNACGETRCFCRPIFASKYKESDTLGNPTICRRNVASLSLLGCLLEDKGIDYSVLHLNDPTCRGRMDEETHLVTFSFRSNRCGTEVTLNDSRIIYSNAITNKNDFSDMIIHHDPVRIDFSCYLNQPGIKSMALTYQDMRCFTDFQ
ncbi:uncharacterized protein LOC119419221 [Nematolebias whitei]|uniref:uncharacterized protein LOC119419221 n=1 Tax=Nematolebias whitei TaxID=451745 RepID=UPI00189801A4|nr:uncharacterized protein LOC119419221 [Nematolebias whitei]